MPDNPTPQSDEDPFEHVGWWCWRGDNHGHLATTACRSDNVPIHVPADWADEMRAVIQRIEDGDDEQPPAVPASSPLPDQTLRDRIAAAIWERQNPGRRWVDCEYRWRADAEADADAVLAVLPPADRAVVLRVEAALVRAHCPDHLDSQSAEGSWINCHCDVADDMERRAAEAQQQPDTETPPVCEGFVWIGQSFAICDRCGQPAWEHVGEEVPAEGAGPFDNRRTVRPWAPGQADRIRAKWGTPTKEA